MSLTLSLSQSVTKMIIWNYEYFPDLCTILQNFVQLCTTLHNFAQLCTTLRNFAKLNFAQLCTTLHKLAQICTTFTNLDSYTQYFIKFQNLHNFAMYSVSQSQRWVMYGLYNFGMLLHCITCKSVEQFVHFCSMFQNCTNWNGPLPCNFFLLQIKCALFLFWKFTKWLNAECFEDKRGFVMSGGKC